MDDTTVGAGTLPTTGVADVSAPAQVETSEQVEGPPDLLDVIGRRAARVLGARAEDLDPNLPLADLGLDSLMAVELENALERELGAELPPGALLNGPSVAVLAGLIAERLSAPPLASGSRGGEGRPSGSSRASGRRRWVPLQPAGSRPRLYMVPAGEGDLIAFQRLAGHLGPDQPVYGLQPPSPREVGDLRRLGIVELAAAYVEDLRVLQPAGPYLLAGYSAGGMVALELARELRRLGEDVRLLVSLDAPLRIPFWFDRHYGFLVWVFTRFGFLRTLRRLGWRRAQTLLHSYFDLGLQTHVAAARGYRALPCPVRVVLLRADRSFMRLTRSHHQWAGVAADGLTCQWVPGTHYRMLREPYARELAAQLRGCLDKALNEQPIPAGGDRGVK